MAHGSAAGAGSAAGESSSLTQWDDSGQADSTLGHLVVTSYSDGEGIGIEGAGAPSAELVRGAIRGVR